MSQSSVDPTSGKRGGARRARAQEIDFSHVVSALKQHMDMMGKHRALDFGVYNSLAEQKATSGTGLLFNVHLLKSLVACSPTATFKASVLLEALVQACTARPEIPVQVQDLCTTTGSLRTALAVVEKRMRVMLAHLRRLKDETRMRQCARTMLPVDVQELTVLVMSVSEDCVDVERPCKQLCTEPRAHARQLKVQESDVSVDEHGWPMITTRRLKDTGARQEAELLVHAMGSLPLPVRKQEVKAKAKHMKEVFNRVSLAKSIDNRRERTERTCA